MIPAYVKKYFWEVDAGKLDPEKHPEYVIARILEYGDPDAARWMMKAFAREAIKKVVRTHRDFSPRTAYFWSLFFAINKREMICLKKSYRDRQKTHWLSSEKARS